MATFRIKFVENRSGKCRVRVQQGYYHIIDISSKDGHIKNYYSDNLTIDRLTMMEKTNTDRL